jgi:hypothetical protein
MALNYAVKENVLCFHGPLIYEAQVSGNHCACLESLGQVDSSELMQIFPLLAAGLGG